MVFHPDLGIVCIEAKAGDVRYEEGEWRYASGLAMRHDGPFNQAANTKHQLIGLFYDKGIGDVLRRCKMQHAVWFPSVDKSVFRSVELPPEASIDLMLFREDMADPQPQLEKILSLGVASIETALSEEDVAAILDKILCPHFGIVASRRLRYDLDELAFVRLLDSQKRVLDFLADQRSAVINGVAGSGKTLIAIERARRAAESGDRVLFLCFNALLHDDIKQRCEEYETVDVYTIAGFACRECKSSQPDYDALNARLERYFDEGDFPYRHVVVDEGQDFAVEAIQQSDVLQTLEALTDLQEGTFYLFYDRNQLVQGTGMPAFIEKADCKLTLYVNCRNTKNIALCACSALGGEAKSCTRESAVSGQNPKLYASADPEAQARFVDESIAELRERGLDDIVVLTCATEERSTLRGWLSKKCRKGRDVLCWKETSILFTTCRKFKGLEADAVILVDVSRSVWLQDECNPYAPSAGLLFYVGASRAKFELRIVCDMGEEECARVLDALGAAARRRPYRELAKKLNAKHVNGI